MMMGSSSCVYLIHPVVATTKQQYNIISYQKLKAPSSSSGSATNTAGVSTSKRYFFKFNAAKSTTSNSTLKFNILPCCSNSQIPVDLAPATSAAYGLLLLGGGLFAYTRSGSKGSLLGGLTGAALMATAYLLMQAPETKEIGDALGFGSALLFASVFGLRLAATRKINPAGPLFGLSICVLVVFIRAYLQDKSLM